MVKKSIITVVATMLIVASWQHVQLCIYAAARFPINFSDAFGLGPGYRKKMSDDSRSVLSNYNKPKALNL